MNQVVEELVEGTFPRNGWGHADSRAARAGQRLAATTGGSWLIRTMVPLDCRVLMRSKGRFTVLGPFGTPLLLLTSTGARSGQRRTTPLVYLNHGERVLVVASNFGRSNHPAWSTNLLAHPQATVTINGEQIAVQAELLEGEDRLEAWRRFERVARTYEVYRTRTDRAFRIFALSHLAAPRGA